MTRPKRTDQEKVCGANEIGRGRIVIGSAFIALTRNTCLFDQTFLMLDDFRQSERWISGFVLFDCADKDDRLSYFQIAFALRRAE